MASKSRDAWRNVATPGWAWAVAGLCGLLLVPLALDNHRLLHTVTPLHLAGPPAARPAELALAGHGAKAHPAAHQPLAVTAGATASAAGAAGPGQPITLAPAGTAQPESGLDLQSPTASLGDTGVAAGAALGPAINPTPVFGAAAPTLLGQDGGASMSTILAAPALARHSTVRSKPISAPLIRPRPVTPKPRFWARHTHLTGPASRVRRRHNPRVFGFFVTITKS